MALKNAHIFLVSTKELLRRSHSRPGKISTHPPRMLLDWRELLMLTVIKIQESSE